MNAKPLSRRRMRASIRAALALLPALAIIGCDQSPEPAPPAPMEVLRAAAIALAEGARAEFEKSTPGACAFPSFDDGGDPVIFPGDGCALHTIESEPERLVVTTQHDLDGDSMVSEFSITVTATSQRPCQAKLGPIVESSWRFAQPSFCPAVAGGKNGSSRRYHDYAAD